MASLVLQSDRLLAWQARTCLRIVWVKRPTGLSAPAAYPLHSIARDFPGVFEPKLFFNVGAMRFDRLWTQVQHLGD